MRTYLSPTRRYRRKSWRHNLPRMDRQVVPGNFQPPATPGMSLRFFRGLAFGLTIALGMWVALRLIAMVWL